MLEADKEYQERMQRFWSGVGDVAKIVFIAILIILAMRWAHSIGVESARFEAMSTGVGAYMADPKTGKTRFIWNTNAIANPVTPR